MFYTLEELKSLHNSDDEYWHFILEGDGDYGSGWFPENWEKRFINSTDIFYISSIIRTHSIYWKALSCEAKD